MEETIKEGLRLPQHIGSSERALGRYPNAGFLGILICNYLPVLICASRKILYLSGQAENLECQIGTQSIDVCAT